MNGILVIDKPAGLTSHDVVARLRRILKTRSIGHTGTLDPFATGVLVMLIGKATRLAQFLDKDAKEYQAVIRFGFETDTGDLTGSPKSKVQSPKSVSIKEIESALESFRGEIEQTPPMYSAKKFAGKKLYELARKGIEIERKPVRVKIYELQITDYELREKTNDFGFWILDFGLKISCSAGTYIRTLAEDIGRKLGVGAHLAELRRTRAGKFEISKAVSLEKLEEIVFENKLDKILISMNQAVSHLPEIKLSAEEINKTKNGIKLKTESAKIADSEFCRMTDKDENLIAVGIYSAAEKTVQPKLVLV
ncbi:MAG: tRNA pseudouridine(55) synthase TruB [Acidobacteria bacterium]|nr:tRNA pseudouridine(55) synthase TruB [Acidobacteriota bacterium]